LLVATAIIAVVAALSLGVLQNSRKKSLRIQAQQQLRNMGHAVVQYIADNDGTFPGSQHSGNSWVGSLLPYFRLGDNATAQQMGKFYRSPGDPNKNRLYSYAINDLLLPKPAGAPKLDFSRVATVAVPSQTLLFAETQQNFTGSDHFHFAYGHGAGKVRSYVAVDRYDGEGIYLFADGHTEWLKWTDVQRRLVEKGGTFIRPDGNK
jgi:hypothetical protein